MSWVICAIVGHKYRVLRRFSSVSRKVGCDRCRGQWAMHDGVRAFVRWDGKFDDFYGTGEAR